MHIVVAVSHRSPAHTAISTLIFQIDQAISRSVERKQGSARCALREALLTRIGAIY